MPLNVSVLAENLKIATSAVGVFSAPKGLQETLMKLEVNDPNSGRLKLTAYGDDGEIAVTYIGAKIHDTGSVYVHAKTLIETVGSMGNERIDMELGTTKVRHDKEWKQVPALVMEQSGSRTSLLIHEPYHDLLDNINSPVQTSIKFEDEEFDFLVKSVGHAAAKDFSRPILTGLHIGPEGLACADGYRLTVWTPKHLIGNLTDETIIPIVNMREFAKAWAKAERKTGDVTLHIYENGKVVFETQHMTVICPVLEGRFPDFNSIIPRSYNSAFMVDAIDMERAIKRAAIFARDNANNMRITGTEPKDVNLPINTLVEGRSAERGDCLTRLEMQSRNGRGNLDSNVFNGAYNYQYMLDAIDTIGSESVVFEYVNEKSPLLIRPGDNPDYVVIVMPMSSDR